jgi:hypothetical protein
VDATQADIAGWALIAGPVMFMIGAACWNPKLFQGELDAVIRNVSTRRFRWAWIHAWMAIGLVGTTGGILTWHSVQVAWPPTVAAAVAAMLFLLATGAFLVGMAVRHGVDGAAASAVSAGQAVPAGLETWQAFLATIHSTYVYLANASAIALGVSAIWADPRLVGVGWAGIIMGALFMVGYRVAPPWFAPPFIPTVFPLVLGIAVLVAL